jgi:uncharacterized damage-inducible protein DinB
MPDVKMSEVKLPEPWLRGIMAGVAAVPRAVLHALALAEEDLDRWCGQLTDEEMHARPAGLSPVAFHLVHIARSIDSLLTYAEGSQLNDQQLAAMNTESDAGATRTDLFAELHAAVVNSAARIRAIHPASFDEPRGVGRKQPPTTVAGLLVHVADHTQRHVGQALTTSKFITAQRK